MRKTSEIDHFFSNNYETARSHFLAAAVRSGGIIESAGHPASGPAGEALATDALLLGSNRDNLLVMTSGTHGVELLCGSGCQTGHLETGRFDSILDRCSILLLHALNPWGAAHQRRNTEDNVDLCRNFMDFTKPLPTNSAYEALHKTIRQASVPEVEQLIADGFAQHGTRDFMNALMSGQYDHADGFSFGGQAPTWSNLTVSSLLAHFGDGFERVCIVDYHSGVGPYGYGSIVCLQEGDALAKTQRIFGDWVIAPREKTTGGPSNFYTVFGHAADGYLAALPNVDLSTVVLEYGTYSSEENLQAMISEHVARFGRDSNPANIEEQGAVVEALHYPADPEWRRAIWDRADHVIDQAISGFDL